MKFLSKPLPILIALIVVLIGLVLINNRERTQRYTVESAIASAKLDSASTIVLQKQNQRTVLSKKGSSWVVEGSPWAVKASRLERLLQDLRGLTRSELLSTREDRKAQYGLDSAQVSQIGVVNGSDTTWVWIGKPDATFSGVYFKMNQEERVYRSPGVIWVDAESRGWKEGKLWSLGQHQLSAVSYTHSGGTRNWNNQDTTEAAKNKWTDISSKAIALEADEFYDSKPELDSVTARLTLTLQSGDSLVAEFVGGHSGKSVMVHPNGQWVGVNSWRLSPFTADQ